MHRKSTLSGTKWKAWGHFCPHVMLINNSGHVFANVPPAHQITRYPPCTGRTFFSVGICYQNGPLNSAAMVKHLLNRAAIIWNSVLISNLGFRINFNCKLVAYFERIVSKLNSCWRWASGKGGGKIKHVLCIVRGGVQIIGLAMVCLYFLLRERQLKQTAAE